VISAKSRWSNSESWIAPALDVGAPAPRRLAFVLRRAGFFNRNAVASEKSRERAAAFRNSPFVQRQDDLIQCDVWSLQVERKGLLGVCLLMAKWFRRAASVHKCRPRKSVASA